MAKYVLIQSWLFIKASNMDSMEGHTSVCMRSNFIDSESSLCSYTRIKPHNLQNWYSNLIRLSKQKTETNTAFSLWDPQGKDSLRNWQTRHLGNTEASSPDYWVTFPAEVAGFIQTGQCSLTGQGDKICGMEKRGQMRYGNISCRLCSPSPLPWQGSAIFWRCCYPRHAWGGGGYYHLPYFLDS